MMSFLTTFIFDDNTGSGKTVFLKEKSEDEEKTVWLTENQVINESVITESYAVLVSENTGKEYNIEESVFVFGRGAEDRCHRVTDNLYVSKKHAVIIQMDGRYFITDFNSKNSTFLNGKQIKDGRKIEIINSDIIKIANERFIFKFKCRMG